MPTPTYTPLANITLGSSAASVTFSSISQAYRDLILVIETLAATGSVGLTLRINGDSGSNYNYVRMDGTGSSAISGSSASQTSMLLAFYGQATTTARAINTLSIMDYSATDKHKTILNRADQAADGTHAGAGRWASTSAITSLAFTSNSGNFAAGSTFSLFGVAA